MSKTTAEISTPIAVLRRRIKAMLIVVLSAIALVIALWVVVAVVRSLFYFA